MFREARDGEQGMPAYGVQSLADMLGIPAFDFVKIDIEGAEGRRGWCLRLAATSRGSKTHGRCPWKSMTVNTDWCAGVLCIHRPAHLTSLVTFVGGYKMGTNAAH